jgi:tetratricopeptide (TPR) repeat protein/S1-C subfamily serine protease
MGQTLITTLAMYRSSLFLTVALVGTTVCLVEQVATAKSASEVEAIARSVAVEIKLQKDGSVGSGVIINKKGDLYTLVTNGHVVCGDQPCSELPTGESYSLGLVDGQKYQATTSSVKLLGDGLDLAIIQFRSNRNYAVAKVSLPGSLKATDKVYTAGFPFEQPGFTFGEGEAIAVVDKRLTGDNGGYTVIYNAFTLPGMSGGGVFNSNGQLVAIHGQGDRYKQNTEIDDKSQVNSKTGYNRGIPVRWLVQSLPEVGIILGGISTSTVRAARSQVPETADEHFIAGFNKLIDPGTNVKTGKRQAIQEFSTTIGINPKYIVAYFMRAYVYEQLQEFQQSLSNYNQAISLNPKYSEAYNNRALLKKNKLNDVQGALADYNQAISLNPKLFGAYNNRAVLKKSKLNDIQGALADYNQAIFLNPKYSEAYNNRANLKTEKLNDIQGALADYNQAISLNPQYSDAYNNRANLKTEKLNDIQGALADYNQAITLNPKDSEIYNNRALLKYPKLNDVQGALADYNQAITLNPKYAESFYNRAILKTEKLNDVQGALADYNQAIAINPQYSPAYYNRAILKYAKLSDRAGAIQDLRQAARLFREQGNIQSSQQVVRALQQLGVNE